MSLFINLKKLGVNTTILATTISLVACGGGGSDGYYNNGSSSGNTEGGNTSDNNQSETDTSNVATHLTRALQNASGQEIQLAPDNSKVYLAVKALNVDNGGIANKNIRLTIATNKFGVTSTNSLVATGTNGVAIFEINVPEFAEAEGSVQLTATVDGTSINIPYTLNIKKSSTLVSDYNISVTQGAVLDIPDGSVDVIATVTDAKGGIKANQFVTLNMPEAMRGKFIISNGSATQVTNAEGQVKYTLKVSSDFTSADVAAFVGKSEKLTFVLVDEHKAERLDTADLTFKVTSQLLHSTLSVIKPDLAVAAKSTKPVIIKVLAKNIQGEPLKDQDVRLNFEKDELAYGVKLNNVTAKTNAQGVAEFSINTADVTHPIALSETGISLKATYVDNSVKVSASTIVGVVTENVNASDPEAIQRLQIASSYKVNAKNDTVAVTVRAINNKGLAATKGKVKLELNDEATSNGVTFIGAAEQNLVEGDAIFRIETNAQTPAAVEALVKAGIKAKFTTDNGVSNSIAITVADEEISEEAVRYLSIEPILTAFDYTKNQKITVRVKATGVKGSALRGETVSLNIAETLSDKQLQDLGLSHTGPSSKPTDADGYATFSLDYLANLSAEQAALATQGIELVAISANGKSQTLRLNFKAPTEQGVIDLDHFTVDMLGDMTLTVEQEKTLTVNITAKGTDGELLKNQLISIGLNDAALNNGVSYDSKQAIRTDENGHAKFTIKVKAGNVSELTNLIANGLTVVVKSTRTDGSAFTVTKKVDIAQPPVVLQELAGLEITSVDDGPLPTVSVLGGEVRVKVVAKDDSQPDGKAIPNTPIQIALSSLTSSRVSLSSNSAVTNSKGEAEFTVRVAEGAYDASLIKNGIVFAVVGTSLNNPNDRVQQTASIQVEIPKDSVNLRLTADQSNLELGKSYTMQVAVKDELGANSAYPVNLALNTEAITAGVKLSQDSVLTSANGQLPVTLTLPKDIPDVAKQALLDKGIQVKGIITNPKGEKLETTLSFTVTEAINTNHLTIQSSKANLSTAGDRSIITVALLDQNNQPVRNQPVTLSANNASTLIIGTPGSGHQTNTSEPQTVITDSNGNAFFSVEIDGNTVDPDLLIASGIELTASHTNEEGTVTQIHRLTAFTPAPVVTQPQPARYSLRVAAAKPIMNVRNDITDVTVTLVDANGGGIADRYVELSVDDFLLNGAIIVGPSGLTTDVNGQAVFKVKVDELARDPNYSAITFAADDLILTAKFKEAGFTDATQATRVNVIQAAVQNPRASIVIGVNNIEVSSLTESGNVYYTRNLSASVIDFDGKPLANQEVTLDITPISYVKGRNLWALAPVPTQEPAMKWVFGNQEYYLNNIAINNNGTPNDPNDDTLFPTVINNVTSCPADPNGTTVNGVPVKVVSFTKSSAALGNTVTYVTDSEGKFDFSIRYPKNYAQWLNVRVGASSTVATLPTRTTYDLGLPPLSTDYSTDGTTSPNEVSPYGMTTNCN